MFEKFIIEIDHTYQDTNHLYKWSNTIYSIIDPQKTKMSELYQISQDTLTGLKRVWFQSTIVVDHKTLIGYVTNNKLNILFSDYDSYYPSKNSRGEYELGRVFKTIDYIEPSGECDRDDFEDESS